MAPPPEPGGDGPPLDLPRIVEALDRHQVEYLVVGGAAALGYGATRPTKDVDCVAGRDVANLDRVADALRELGARLHVEGVSDEEAKQLPVQLDGRALTLMEISTWTTDAGDVDVLANIPDRAGGRVSYPALLANAEQVQAAGVRLNVAGLDDIIASKEWANRPKDHEALGELRTIRGARAAVVQADSGLSRPTPGRSAPATDPTRPSAPGQPPGRDSGPER